MSLIFKNYMKKLLNNLLCLRLKNKVILSWEFQESLKKVNCAGLAMPFFPNVNLNYSIINTLPSHHSTYNIFAVAAMILAAKITLCFSLEREKLCLQAFRMRVNIHFGPFRRNNTITWKKSSMRDGIPHL